MKNNNRKRREEEYPDDYGRSMKRALVGELPSACSKEDNQSVVRTSDSSSSSRRSRQGLARHGDQSSRISAANKARSLLNLARQLRSESIESSNAHDSERAASGDPLVRQALLGAGSGIEFFDDATGELGDVDSGDIFGIISSGAIPNGAGGMLQLDMQDPFSRLVANIQARVNRSSSSTVLNGLDNDAGTGTTDTETSSTTTETSTRGNV